MPSLWSTYRGSKVTNNQGVVLWLYSPETRAEGRMSIQGLSESLRRRQNRKEGGNDGRAQELVPVEYQEISCHP